MLLSFQALCSTCEYRRIFVARPQALISGGFFHSSRGVSACPQLRHLIAICAKSVVLGRNDGFYGLIRNCYIYIYMLVICIYIYTCPCYLDLDKTRLTVARVSVQAQRLSTRTKNTKGVNQTCVQTHWVRMTGCASAHGKL